MEIYTVHPKQYVGDYNSRNAFISRCDLSMTDPHSTGRILLIFRISDAFFSSYSSQAWRSVSACEVVAAIRTGKKERKWLDINPPRNRLGSLKSNDCGLNSLRCMISLCMASKRSLICQYPESVIASRSNSSSTS